MFSQHRPKPDCAMHSDQESNMFGDNVCGEERSIGQHAVAIRVGLKTEFVTQG